MSFGNRKMVAIVLALEILRTLSHEKRVQVLTDINSAKTDINLGGHSPSLSKVANRNDVKPDSAHTAECVNSAADF